MTSRYVSSSHWRKNSEGTSTVSSEPTKDTGRIGLNQVENFCGSMICSMNRRQLFQMSICLSDKFTGKCFLSSAKLMKKKLIKKRNCYWINKTFSLYNKRQIKIMSIYQLVDNQSIMLIFPLQSVNFQTLRNLEIF